MSHYTVIYRWADPAALLARSLFRVQHGPDFGRQWVAVVPHHDTCDHPWINTVEMEIDGATLIAGDDPLAPREEGELEVSDWSDGPAELRTAIEATQGEEIERDFVARVPNGAVFRERWTACVWAKLPDGSLVVAGNAPAAAEEA